MKKLSILTMVLVLVLAFTGTVSAVTIALVDIVEGDLGSASNPTRPSDIVTIIIESDTALLSLDAIITISFTGEITDAISKSTAVAWGWMSEFTFDPIYTGDTKVHIGAGNFFGGTTAFIVIHIAGAGDVVVTLTPHDGHGGTKLPGGGADVPDSDFSSSTVTIHEVPEPMTIALLGLGGLFLRRRKNKTLKPLNSLKTTHA